MPTLEEIISELQENAASENYHEYFDMYQKIAKHSNEETAIKVMSDILNNMNGFM